MQASYSGKANRSGSGEGSNDSVFFSKFVANGFRAVTSMQAGNKTTTEAQSRIKPQASFGRCAEWLATLVLVALAATVVIAPTWFFGDAAGHDFQYHVASWVEMVRQWHQGILFPRWAEWANWGYGGTRFIFYPPASRIIGAVLGLAFPWQAVASAYIWVVLVGSGMAMWTLARQFLSKREAAAAAVFFAVNPYSLALVYYRSDFAELLTVAMFPVLMLAVLRIARDGWREVPFLAVAFAAIWMCDAPGAVIATYSAVLLLVVSACLRRTTRTLLSGATGIVFGFGLAAFYILPAAWEERWASLGAAINGDYRFTRSFLFSSAGNPQFQLFNLRISAIAMGMIVICAALAALAGRHRGIREPWGIWLALGGAAVFMMIRPSSFLWRLLPEMKFVQFPWRWLDALAPVFALFAAAAFSRRRERWIAWICILVLIGATGIAIGRTTWWDTDSARDIALWMKWGVGYTGTDEFAPRGSDRYALYAVNPAPDQPPQNTIALATQFDPLTDTIVPLNGVRVHVESWTAERRVFSTQSARPVNLGLRLLAYPAWDLRIDGRNVAIQATPAGNMWFRAPAGAHEIDLTFRRTRDRLLGGVISLLSAMLLCGWAAKTRFSQDRK